MMEWSLPADKSWEYTNLKHQLEVDKRQNITQFMYSGLWRNFLVKYPEINRMHKKMLRAHRKVYQARDFSKGDCGLQELWQAQHNCPYWHGVFGGIYLADIRATTYGCLVRAETKADGVIRRKMQLKKKPPADQHGVTWQKLDFDDDGSEELLVDGNEFSVYLSPKEGGSIFEWDLRNYSYNVLSTLARRPEAYHRVLTEASADKQTGDGSAVPSIHDLIRVKDKDSLSHLMYDSYPRSSLIDHFFEREIVMEQFTNGSYRELGNFANQQYDYQIEKKSKRLEITLKRAGALQIKSNLQPFEVQKEITLIGQEDGMHVTYLLKNKGELSIRAVFGCEWNINMLGGGHNEQAYYRVPGTSLEDSHLDSMGELTDVGEIVLGNRNLGFELEAKIKPKVRLWRFPVESVSNSEGGIELIYQQSCLVALLPLDLAPGRTADFDLIWNVKKTSQEKSGISDVRP